MLSKKMGFAENIAAKVHNDPEATPKFYHPQSVPYAIKGKIEQELQWLENEGVVSKVGESEWVAPHSTYDEVRRFGQIMRGLQSHCQSGYQVRFTAMHRSNVALIIGLAIGIGQYCISVTLSVIVVFPSSSTDL